MPNFDNIQQKRDRIVQAAGLLDSIRAVYSAAKVVQGALALYQAGTDTAFVASVNALFTAGEKQELNQMLTDINMLVTRWETDHAAAISG